MVFPLIRSRDDDRIRALDPRTPKSELVNLAAHRAAEVKAAVAGRIDCPLAAMLSLVHEADARILEALVANPAAPRAVLEALAEHRRETVRALATRRLRTAAFAA